MLIINAMVGIPTLPHQQRDVGKAHAAVEKRTGRSEIQVGREKHGGVDEEDDEARAEEEEENTPVRAPE